MPAPRPASWSQLAHLPLPKLERVAAAARRRFLREELPLAPHYDQLALGELRSTAPEELPILQAGEIQRDPTSFVLRPEPRALRKHWPFARKFALAMAGPRSTPLLQHAYACVRVEQDRIPGGPSLELHSTAHDMDLLAEAGARCLDLLDLARPGARALCALTPADTSPFWAFALAQTRSATRVDLAASPLQPGSDAELSRLEQAEVLIGSPGSVAWLLEEAAASGRRPQQLHTLAIVTRRLGPALRGKLARLAKQADLGALRLARITQLPGTRLPLASCPVDLAGEELPELHTQPDFLWLETVEGRVLCSTIAARGTALLRLDTQMAADSILTAPCPHCRRTLPRLPGDLAPAAPAAPAAQGEAGEVLDGLDDLLAWRARGDGLVDLLPGRGADPAQVLARVMQLLPGVAARLAEGHETLDWLGGASEREEQDLVPRPA